jgi:ketosteroid isomerase-like protein
MSEENVEVVRSVLASLMARDLETVRALIDPRIVVDATRNVINPTIYVGIDGLWEMEAAVNEAWEKIGTEAYEFIDGGDQVVVIGRLVGKGRASGVAVERPTAQVWTLQDGRIVRWEYGYTNPQDALKVAGLTASAVATASDKKRKR